MPRRQAPPHPEGSAKRYSTAGPYRAAVPATRNGASSESGRSAGVRRSERERARRAFVLQQLRRREDEVGRSAGRGDAVNKPGAGDDQADDVIEVCIVIDAAEPRGIGGTRIREGGKPDDQGPEEDRQARRPRTNALHNAFAYLCARGKSNPVEDGARELQSDHGPA